MLGYYRDEKRSAKSYVEANGERWFITGDNAQCGVFIARAAGVIPAEARVYLGDTAADRVRWADVSGQGNDFDLGVGSESTKPAFVSPTAGERVLGKDTYFLFDGNDCFRKTVDGGFVDSLGQSNVASSWAVWRLCATSA